MKILFLSFLLLFTFGCRRPMLPASPADGVSATRTGVLNVNGFNRIKEIRELEIGHNPIRQLAVLGNRLFYVSLNGYFFQVNLESFKTEGNVKLTDGISGAPAVAYPLLFFSSEKGNDGLLVYDLKKAETVRRLDTEAGQASPVIVANRLIHCALNGRITAFSLPGLQKMWSVELGQPIVADPLVSGDNVLITGQDGHLASYRAGDGMLNWSIDLKDAFYTPPAHWQAHLYWAAYSGNVYQIDENTGERLRTYKGTVPVYQSPRANATGLYVPYADGTLRAFKTTSADVRWTRKLDGPFSAPLLLTSRVLYCSQMSRKFYILSLGDGSVLQTEEPDGRVLSQPLQIAGHLYLMISPGIIKEYQNYEN